MESVPGTPERDQNSDQEEDSQVPDDDPPLVYPKGGNSASLANVECRLEGQDVWLEFHQLGTEMIITKSGR